MMLQIATKSKVSAPLVRWNKPASQGRTIYAEIARTKTNHTARTCYLPLPSISLGVGLSYDNGRYTATTTAATNTTSGRTSVGNNVFTLARYAKSSCAAIDHDADNGYGEDNINGSRSSMGRTHAGVEGRSYQEAWMVNLGRGDEAWLSGPRSADWFTGVHPMVCPGKCMTYLCAQVVVSGAIREGVSHFCWG